MHVHLPEGDFGKLRIWRPKEVLYRYGRYSTVQQELSGGGMGVQWELYPASVGSRAGGDNRKRRRSAQRRVGTKA
jgi:hypothetical protein